LQAPAGSPARLLLDYLRFFRQNAHSRILKSHTQKLVRTGVAASAVLILLLLAGTAGLTLSYLRATRWVDHTTTVISDIQSTRAILSGTSALSGALLRVKVYSILDQFDRVQADTRDNPRQVHNADEFRSIFYDPASGQARTSFQPADISAANAILDHMQLEEDALLIQRIAVQSDATRNGAVLGLTLCLALLLLGGATGLALRRELSKRTLAEATLQREKSELTRYTEELALVSTGSRMIQAARDEEQVNQIVAQVMRELLPGSSGFFAIVSPSRDLLEICCRWGELDVPAAFLPADCVALQISRPVHRSQSRPRIDCPHVHRDEGDYVCIPVQGAGGHIGVLHAAVADAIAPQKSDQISLFAAKVGLGIANLRMREALRSQTVRDPLTGLFNRRYFDETLHREFASAARQLLPLSVLLMDVDHFKRLNDERGHTAGDDALRAFGRILRSTFRDSDVVCRYGGEEFAIILPGADLRQACTRAESLRRLVAESDLTTDGRSVVNFTISVGVATADEFRDPHALIRAADAALYQAKRSGRNAVWVCSDQTVPLPSLPAETANANPSS
jgi:diguanylate cyclase (GGDEF)-like protein